VNENFLCCSAQMTTRVVTFIQASELSQHLELYIFTPEKQDQIFFAMPITACNVHWINCFLIPCSSNTVGSKIQGTIDYRTHIPIAAWTGYILL